jgi:hypothetical protein
MASFLIRSGDKYHQTGFPERQPSNGKGCRRQLHWAHLHFPQALRDHPGECVSRLGSHAERAKTEELGLRARNPSLVKLGFQEGCGAHSEPLGGHREEGEFGHTAMGPLQWLPMGRANMRRRSTVRAPGDPAVGAWRPSRNVAWMPILRNVVWMSMGRMDMHACSRKRTSKRPAVGARQRLSLDRAHVRKRGPGRKCGGPAVGARKWLSVG